VVVIAILVPIGREHWYCDTTGEHRRCSHEIPSFHASPLGSTGRSRAVEVMAGEPWRRLTSGVPLVIASIRA
jgi:hypothetical protein